MRDEVIKTLRWLRQAFIRMSMSRLVTFGCNSKVPERNIALGYLFYIIVGFVLIILPWSHRTGGYNLVDDFFTIVSAVSTTGLATVDVPAVYTPFGMTVILLMIQTGAIGYMTVSSYIMLHLSRRMTDRSFRVMSSSLPVPQGVSMRSLVDNVVHFTFIFELAGFVALWIIFGSLGVDSPAWSALFISVSSFCTAGFSTFPDSLCAFQNNLPVNITVAALSFAGAMGFIVITDLRNKCFDRRYRITFTTKVILVMTLSLTLLGTVVLTVFPAADQSASLPVRVLESFFQTMSAMTTVGYNTFNLATLMPPAVLVLSVIMFIGASPSGTGGGVKCTTVSAVYAFVMSKLRGDRNVTLGGNRLPDYRINSALANIIVYGTVLLAGVLLLVISEKFTLSQVLFECASALGTVGVSLGITPELSVFGKFVIIALMYIGRIGVLTLGVALSPHALRTDRRQSDIAL